MKITAKMTLFSWFVVTLVVLEVVFFATIRLRTVEVDNENIPDGFPLLVISSSNEGRIPHAAVIPYYRLNKYLKKHRNSSFLIPSGTQQQLNEQVAKPVKPNSLEKSGHFKVLSSLEGKQTLRVTSTYAIYQDTSWYIADENSFTAKRYRASLTPAFAAIIAGVYSVPISIIIWIPLLLIRWLISIVRRNALSG